MFIKVLNLIIEEILRFFTYNEQIHLLSTEGADWSLIIRTIKNSQRGLVQICR